MRRVVITGLGLISPLASGVEKSWSRILNGDSGASLITRFDADRVATKYACEVPIGDGSDGTFNADDWMEPKERRKVDDFILYGIAAAIPYKMKSSTFLLSFGSIQSSALKVPSEPSPIGTSQAYFVATRSASKRVIKLAPESPLSMRDQLFSTPLARGDINPKPVITTRRIL